MNLSPSLEGLSNLSVMGQAQSLYQEKIIWLPMLAILVYMLLSFLLIGLVKVGRHKRLIQQGNYWLIFFVVILVSVVLYIVNMYFPFWIDILIK